MSNTILYHLLVISGKIKLESVYHIGSGRASKLTDMAIRRDVAGHPYLPASSLAGLLRATAEDLSLFVLGQEACHNRDGQVGNHQRCPVCALFGYAPPKGRKGSQAARVFVADALAYAPIQNTIEVRDHVGINRRRGAAQPNLQFTQEVASQNTELVFDISIEDATVSDIALLLAVFDLWETYGFQLGGRSTTGLGAAKLVSPKFFSWDFSDKNQLKKYLTTDQVNLKDREISRSDLQGKIQIQVDQLSEKQDDLLAPQHVFVDVELVFEEPILVAGASLGLGEADVEFIRTIQADGNEIPIIPGSGLKGVLRTRTEQIVRTLDGHACAVTHTKDGTDPLVACFGTPKEQDDAEMMSFEDLYQTSCSVCQMFGNSMMRGRLTVGEAQLFSNTRLTEKKFDHVAIDRFSGGASDAKKFDTRPALPSDQALFFFRLHLDHPEPWMVGLLGLLLKDLQDADVRIGRATHRGYGKVRANKILTTILALNGTTLSTRLYGANMQPKNEKFGPYSEYEFNWPVNAGMPGAQFVIDCHADFLTKLGWKNQEGASDAITH